MWNSIVIIPSFGKRLTARVFIHSGRVAQLVEHWTENPGVGGSIPPPSTFLLCFCILLLIQCSPPKERVHPLDSPSWHIPKLPSQSVWRDTADIDGDRCWDEIIVIEDSIPFFTIHIFLCPADPIHTEEIRLRDLCLEHFEYLPLSHGVALLIGERCSDHGWGYPVTSALRILGGSLDTLFTCEGVPLVWRRRHLAAVGILNLWQFHSPEAEFLPELYTPVALDTVIIFPPDSQQVKEEAVDSLLQRLVQQYQVAKATRRDDPVSALQLARLAAAVMFSAARFGRMHQLHHFIRQEETFWQQLPEESRILLDLVRQEVQWLQKQQREL